MENGGNAVALAATGVFAGAALFISAVEHPAAMKTSISGFYNFFPNMYARAAPMQASLAVLGSGAALVSAATAADSDTNSKLLWCTSGAMLGAVVPFTLFSMMKTNKEIIKQDQENTSKQSELLTTWGQLHNVRTVLSCASFAIMIATVLRRCNKA